LISGTIIVTVFGNVYRLQKSRGLGRHLGGSLLLEVMFQLLFIRVEKVSPGACAQARLSSR
jgi:hypothetical protein